MYAAAVDTALGTSPGEGWVLDDNSTRQRRQVDVSWFLRLYWLLGNPPRVELIQLCTKIQNTR